MDKRIDCNSCPLRCIETDDLCEQYCSDMADFIDEIRADAIDECINLIKMCCPCEEVSSFGLLVCGLEKLKEKKNE